MPREVGRFGAGRSAKSRSLVGLVAGGTAGGGEGGSIEGSLGSVPGEDENAEGSLGSVPGEDENAGCSLGSVPGEDGSGIATRALQPAHVTNLAPASTLASGTRFCAPQ